MMATDDIPIEPIPENKTSTGKPSKRGKRALRSANSNGDMENGTSSLSESISSRSPKRFEAKKINETSTHLETTEQNAKRNFKQLDKLLTPVTSSRQTSSNAGNFHPIELSTVTDDDDDDNNKQDYKIDGNHLVPDSDAMVSSYTTGVSASDNDVIEIHQFSLADIDAYLDIYFEILDNRLRHFIGDNEQLQQFRVGMKNRLNSDLNAREYQNVLLGKINSEVVAAVTLSFPNESTTVSNDSTLAGGNSCLTSIRRWMIRKANYIPNNSEECYIEMIGVKNAYQNRGIGAAMLECVEHFARQAGARLLTIHTNGERLQNYFQRFGFVIDHSDSSAFWKWTVERQSANKMSKTISPEGEDNAYSMDNTGSYINESMVGSVDE
jgi:GNAT superfamily N-acetyltransferase